MKIIEAYVPISQFTRTGKKLKEFRGIVIHYPEWPNGSAKKIIDDNTMIPKINAKLPPEKFKFASFNEVIDLNGDIYLTVPEDEMCYHVGSNSYSELIRTRLNNRYPNLYLYGIEATHIDKEGRMTDETFDSLVKRCAYLLKKYSLTVNELYRHFDITGKRCPLWFVTNYGEWIQFKKLVDSEMRKI